MGEGKLILGGCCFCLIGWFGVFLFGWILLFMEGWEV